MYSKLAIIGLLITSILGVSASGRAQVAIRQVILQDDRSNDHLVFDITTGEYKFESCKGNFSIGGVGSVDVTGCKVVLKDMSDNRRVVAEVDLCDGAGKADIAVEGPSISNQSTSTVLEFVISDSKISDSAFACDPKVIEMK